jgi:hypothetical protein
MEERNLPDEQARSSSTVIASVSEHAWTDREQELASRDIDTEDRGRDPTIY